MIPASAGLVMIHHHLIVGVLLLVIVVLGFEFSVVSAISLGAELVPGSPARGLGLLIGVDTVGRATMSVPATRLYLESRHRLAGSDDRHLGHDRGRRHRHVGAPSPLESSVTKPDLPTNPPTTLPNRQ